MDNSSIVLEDGAEEHTCLYDSPDHGTVIQIETENAPLDPNHEHAYLSGMCDVIRDTGYGMMDLRRLEENIATVHGHKNSKFQHSWYSAYSEPRVSDSIPVELVFTHSQKKIKSPCMMPHLQTDHRLILLSNLQDREVAVAFAKTLLNQRSSQLSLARLEKAVLAELDTQSNE